MPPRTLSNYLLLFCFIGVVTSCDILGSGPCLEGGGSTKKEVRDVPAFKGVDLRLPGKVIISEGTKSEVSIETYNNLLSEISTEVEGSTLVIRSGSCLEFSNEEASYYITLPEIENVELKSSGQIRIQAVPSSKKLNLNLSGSGNLYYSGNTGRISASNSGSGDMLLEGSANSLETKVSGSGKLEGYFLKADTVKAVSTGSGNQRIWVTQILDASIEGSGNIYYRGTPYLRTTTTKGSGKVINDN